MKLKGIALVAVAAGIWVSVALAGSAQVVLTTKGTVGALSSGSIRVGSLACKVGPHSPGSAVQLGDAVGISCKNGLLTRLRKLHLTTLSDEKLAQLNDSPVFAWTEGTIGVLGSSSIAVGALTCSLGSSLPSLTGYQVGDGVRIGCGDGVLMKIEKLPARPVFTSASGTLSALGSSSITVGALTCSLGSSSPDLSGYHVGDTVRIGCADGVLAKIEKPEPKPVFSTAFGTLSAIGSSSITVDSLTCSVDSRSPSLAGYHVGDTVRIGCADGVLAKIEKPHAPPAPATAFGAIAALTATSITVGPLTCSVGPSSPSLAGYQVGDRVGIGCLDGMLAKVGRPPEQQPQQPQQQFKTEQGAVSALGGTSITVGSLTCSLGAGSPSLTGVQVGDHVGIGCADGVVTKIAKLTDQQPSQLQPQPPQQPQQQLGTAQGAVTALGATSIT